MKLKLGGTLRLEVKGFKRARGGDLVTPQPSLQLRATEVLHAQPGCRALWQRVRGRRQELHELLRGLQPATRGVRLRTRRTWVRSRRR